MTSISERSTSSVYGEYGLSDRTTLVLDAVRATDDRTLLVLLRRTLTENNGRKAYFRHVTIVMTTNVGAQEMSRASVGFMSQDHSTDGMEALKKLFSPEFRNRLDSIIQFAPLEMDSVMRVVDKLVVELEAKLGNNAVTLELDDRAREWIAERGYDPKMGARPMARIIQEHIKRPLAEELLFGSLENGGHVRITVDKDGELELVAEPVLKELEHLSEE